MILCSIAGHREGGDEATVNVVEGAVGPGEGDHGDHEGPEADWAELDRLMEESILAFPAETDGVGNQILEPEVLSDGTKEFHLDGGDHRLGGRARQGGRGVDLQRDGAGAEDPGRGGDKVRVVVENQLPMGTDVHRARGEGPEQHGWGRPLTQPLIKSGESFVYEFTTRSRWWHVPRPSSRADAGSQRNVRDLHGRRGGNAGGPDHLGVEIPTDLEVAQEIPMVLNDAGVIGLSLNGKSFPATQPYTGKVAIGWSSITTTRGCRSTRCISTNSVSWSRQGRRPVGQPLLDRHPQRRPG